MTDERALQLAAFDDADLRAELARRQRVRDAEPRRPAGRCARCGAEWFFVGAWSPPNFGRQAEAFAKAHVNCPLAIDGAGI